MIQTITGLTAKTRVTLPAAFALDLNCAIYHCVRKVQQRTPYDPKHQRQWERALIDNVIAYIKVLVGKVEPTEHVYIAVDGVAPMAKIKQQRARRFKSAIGAEEEARIKADARGELYNPSPRWDTNAITPGTNFMTALASALRTYARTSPKILVSPADEPGEGEQKIMEWARTAKPASMVVYGLDADLIVLALWASATSSRTVDLFREEVEFSGGVKMNALDEEQFLFMDMGHLATILHAKYGRPHQRQDEFIQDFVGLMNLLGNDFVPHGMALKIRDDGVQKLLELYNSLTAPLIQIKDDDLRWHYNRDTLIQLFEVLSTSEQKDMLRNVKKKLEARPGNTAGKTPEERALALYNDTPLTWAAETVLVKKIRLPEYEYPQFVLREDWKTTYDKEALQDADPAMAAASYLQTLAWTLAYYSGAPIDTHWYYPWFLPPRHATIVETLRAGASLNAPAAVRRPLEPKEQLAMVLPESSFDLLPAEYKKLLDAYPWAWPTAWGAYSFGRRFLWECEPLIPLIQPSEIKGMIDTVLDD